MKRVRSMSAIVLCFICMYADAQFSYKVTVKANARDSAAWLRVGAFQGDLNNPGSLIGYWDKSFVPAMKIRLVKIVDLIKETFPGPHGFLSKYDAGMNKGSFVANGPRGYSLTYLFLPFGISSTGEPFTEDETATWLYFYINNPALNFQHSIKRIIDGKPQVVYETYPLQGRYKDCDVYGRMFFDNEAWTSENGALYLLITRSGEKAFKTITRRQYLEPFPDEIFRKYQHDTAELSLQDQRQRKQLADSKEELRTSGSNPYIKAGLEARIRDIEKDLLVAPDRKKNLIKDMETKYLARTKVIADYLATAPADSLNQPAIVYTHQDLDKCADWFVPGPHKSPPTMFVVANHAYWRTDEDKAAPQTIGLWFRFESYSWPHRMIMEEFKKNFPVEKFRDLLDK